jgi:hypothetical protein
MQTESEDGGILTHNSALAGIPTPTDLDYLGINLGSSWARFVLNNDESSEQRLNVDLTPS